MFKVDRFAKALIIGDNRLSLPVEDELEPFADSAFDAAARAIMLEFDRRQNGRSGNGHEFLLTITYELMLYLIENDNIECLQRRIKKFGRYRKGKKSGLTLFHYLIMSISAHVPELLNARDRERIAKSAWYAYIHRVPSAFIVGFVRTVRNSDFYSRIRTGELDRRYQEWIIGSLVYPDEIFPPISKYPEHMQKAALERRRFDNPSDGSDERHHDQPEEDEDYDEYDEDLDSDEDDDNFDDDLDSDEDDD